MELSKQHADAVEANAGLTPEPLIAPVHLDRRLRPGLRLALRRRLRPPALRPRDGVRHPATPPGSRGLGAGLHPFVGALIAAESLGKDATAEARVGLTGPILGTAVNPINLLPVLPLDGGPALAVLGPMIWLAGILIAIAATVIFLGPFMLVFVLLLAVPSSITAFPRTP